MKSRLRLLFLFWVFLLLPLHALAEDRTRFGWDILVASDETVSDVVCIGCSVRVQGTVSGDVVAIAGNVTVEGRVRTEIVVVGGDVRLLAGASVGDEIVTVGGRVVPDPGATWTGEAEESIYFHLPGQPVFYWQGMLMLILFNIAVVLLVGLILRPRRLENMAGSLRRHYLLVPLLGLALILAVSLSYGLASLLGRWEDWGYTVLNSVLLGVPLLGYAGIAQLIGKLVARTGHPAGILLAGAAGTTLLLLLPRIGFFLAIVFFVLGFGVVAVSGLGHSPDWLPARLRRPHQPSAA